MDRWLGSSKAKLAVSKLTPCLRTLSRFLFGSHSKRMRPASSLDATSHNNGLSRRRSMLLPCRVETERRPFLDRRAQIPGVAGEEHRHAVMVLRQRRPVAQPEAVEFAALAVEPARRLVGRAVEPGGEAVFRLQPGLQYVELQAAD